MTDTIDKKIKSTIIYTNSIFLEFPTLLSDTKGYSMRETIAHRRPSDGKDQSVLLHLTETGQLAAQFAAKANLEDQGNILGLLHDFGKYSNEFQRYIASGVGELNADDEGWVDSKLLKGKIDHSSAGAQYIWQWCKQRSPKTGHGELAGQIFAICIASHHSGLINCISSEGNQDFHNRMEKADTKTHLSESTKLADQALLDRLNELLSAQFLKHFFSVINVKTSTSIIESFRLGMVTRFLFSCLIDADRLNSAEFESPERKTARLERAKYYNWQTPIDRLENQFETFVASNSQTPSPINEIRSSIANDCLEKASSPQGIYTLTVPTGGGKTLSSLRFALHHAQEHKLDRIIYIIPYTSIIEQNAKAIRDIIEKNDDPFPWVLEHHSNLEPDDEWRSKLVSENWDSPIVFTTMVQFLEALFSGGTRSVRRLHQLANAVLIFDEIQTLPINCTHLFCNAINYLTESTKTTAVLCTATQPVLDKLDSPEKGQLMLVKDHEIVQDTKQLFSDLSRVTVNNKYKQGGWSIEEITELALKNYRKFGSCLIIVNTKAWATDLFKSCSEKVETDAIYHLSTNQCAAHRKDKLAEIRARLDQGKPTFCVSTQLIEAGVDVDFAYAIRFVAGLDSVAQAAGRCNRNGKLTDHNGILVKGQVDVVNPDKETIQSLIDIKAGQDITLSLFADSQGSNLLAPELMTEYFQRFFFDRQDDMRYPILNKEKQPENLLNWLSTNDGNVGNQNLSRSRERKIPLLQQSFREAGDAFKAIDSQARPLIVPYGKEGEHVIAELCGLAKEFDPQKYYATLKSAQKFSVNVFPNVWRKLEECGAIKETQVGEGIFYLNDQYHSDEYGLSTEKVNGMPTMSL